MRCWKLLLVSHWSWMSGRFDKECCIATTSNIRLRKRLCSRKRRMRKSGFFQSVNSPPDLCCSLHAARTAGLHAVQQHRMLRSRSISTLRAHAARKSNSHYGLRPVVRCNLHGCPPRFSEFAESRRYSFSKGGWVQSLKPITPRTHYYPHAQVLFPGGV